MNRLQRVNFSSSFKQLPIIDINPLVQHHKSIIGQDPKQIPLEVKEVASNLHKACRDVGFMYIKGHNVPSSLVDLAREECRLLFKSPQEIKNQIAMNQSQHTIRAGRGYQRIGENVTKGQRDWHEAIDLYKEFDQIDVEKGIITKEGSAPLQGKNLWPNQNIFPNFKPTLDNYIQQMDILGNIIMKGLAIGLGLPPNYFVPFYDRSFWVMRCIYYPPTATRENTFNGMEVGYGCGSHTDYGCLTFVNQDNIKGCLQVKNLNGEWINAEPIKDTFVVNIGDMLSAWTGGLYVATDHRVVSPANHHGRVSIPFFFEPNFDAMVGPLDFESLGLVDVNGERIVLKNKPKSFNKIKYGDHLISKVTSNFNFGDPSAPKKGKYD